MKKKLPDLLWVLEHTVDLWPALSKAITDILASQPFTAQDFLEPRSQERAAKGHLPPLGAVTTGEVPTDEEEE